MRGDLMNVVSGFCRGLMPQSAGHHAADHFFRFVHVQFSPVHFAHIVFHGFISSCAVRVTFHFLSGFCHLTLMNTHRFQEAAVHFQKIVAF